MRFKVGNTWHELAPGQPLMVELTDFDLVNIRKMAPGCNKYAHFDDSETTTADEKLAWMNEPCPKDSTP